MAGYGRRQKKSLTVVLGQAANACANLGQRVAILDTARPRASNLPAHGAKDRPLR